MTRDGDIPTIFNPRGRNRTPSVLVTDDGASAAANGPFSHADSITSSQQDAGEPLSPNSSANAPSIPQQTQSTGLASKIKSCSTSFCSKSARKVRIFV